jgi:LL-diaminopimelate aminotransferase
MTGDRIGFAVGNKELVAGLTKVKSQIDSGPPVYTQKVAVKALAAYAGKEAPDFLKKNNQILRERRDLLVRTLCQIGFKCEKPKATFYVWVNCKGESMQFATKLLDVGVAVTPGVGFGKCGEGYARITFTQPKERIIEACNRIASAF